MLHAAAVRCISVWADSRTTYQHSLCYFTWIDEYSHTDWNMAKHKHPLCQRESFCDCNKFQSSSPALHHITRHYDFFLISFPFLIVCGWTNSHFSKWKYLDCVSSESGSTFMCIMFNSYTVKYLVLRFFFFVLRCVVRNLHMSSQIINQMLECVALW